MGLVAIITSNNEAIVEQCDKTIGNRFTERVQTLISGLESMPLPIASPVPAVSSNLDQLEKLFELKQKGILSEEEFLAQKAKLLG